MNYQDYMEVWYYPRSNELVCVFFDPTTGFALVNWGDTLEIYEPSYLIRLEFVKIGKL